MADIVIDLMGPSGRTALSAAARAESAAQAASLAISRVRADDNSALGQGAFASLTTGVANAAFGALALRDLTTGNNNVALGDQALRELEGGSSNVAIGVSTDRINVTGSRNTTVGSEAGLMRASGDDSVTIGFGAQAAVTAGGSANVVIGRSAMSSVSGDDNVAVGAFAMAGSGQPEHVNNSIAIGASAVTTRSNQIVLGNGQHDEIVLLGTSMFRKAGMSNNLFLGNAGNLTATQGANIAVGHTAGFSITNADSVTLVGYEAGYNVTSGGNNTALGARALLSATTASDCTAIGAGALNRMITGVGTTAVGRYALQCIKDGGNSTAVGDAAGRNAHGEQNCLMGYGVMRYNYAGSYNVVLGQGALYHAGKAPGLQPEDGGDPGPLMRANDVVAGPHNPSSFNAIVGWQAFENTSGGGHCALGANAGRSLTSGDDNIFIGRDAGFGSAQKPDASGCTVIGVAAVATRDHEVVIGKSTDSHVTIAGVEFTKADLQALKALL